MTTDMTKAILIEVIEMLQMINKTIIDLSDDIMRDAAVSLSSDEAEAGESERWAKLYARSTEALHSERSRVKELEERVWQLETELFKTIVKP